MSLLVFLSACEVTHRPVIIKNLRPRPEVMVIPSTAADIIAQKLQQCEQENEPGWIDVINLRRRIESGIVMVFALTEKENDAYAGIPGLRFIHVDRIEADELMPSFQGLRVFVGEDNSDERAWQAAKKCIETGHRPAAVLIGGRQMWNLMLARKE